MKVPIVQPPQPGSREEKEDLLRVIRQYQNPKVPDGIQEDCDKRMEVLFEDYLRAQGEKYPRESIKKVHNGLRPIIFKLKEYYDRPRPSETAENLGIDFSGDDLDTAQSPSYPSGHTIQAYVQAILLSDMFPDHMDSLMRIAELVSQSRVDRGVHFQSDVDFGRKIAYLIAMELLDGSN
jgi:acid phosphatase (class A)